MPVSAIDGGDRLDRAVAGCQLGVLERTVERGCEVGMPAVEFRRLGAVPARLPDIGGEARRGKNGFEV